MRFHLLLLSVFFCGNVWSEGVDRRFQGLWLRYVDGKPLLSEITEDRIDENECEGFSQLTDGQRVSKNCYAFADSGGDVYKTCLHLKGNKLVMQDEARGKKFSNSYTRFSGTLADFKKKHCPTTKANSE